MVRPAAISIQPNGVEDRTTTLRQLLIGAIKVLLAGYLNAIKRSIIIVRSQVQCLRGLCFLLFERAFYCRFFCGCCLVVETHCASSTGKYEME